MSKKNKRKPALADSPDLFAAPKGIVVKHKKSKPANILKSLPNAEIIDVTSQAPDDFVRFSPFYPHGNIPVPLWPNLTGASVEAIWQGLKVFEGYPENPRKGPDFNALRSTKTTGVKRTTRVHGRVLGHLGGNGDLLSYFDARKKIYLPAYKYVLENYLTQEVEKLRSLAGQKIVVLLDYSTNAKLDDVSSPLSHAALIKMFIEGRWPKED